MESSPIRRPVPINGMKGNILPGNGYEKSTADQCASLTRKQTRVR
ncbi:peptidase [Pseudomonas aeruginosa]|nr:peptidase [Pseudomonas aeruginosa]